MAIAKVVTQLRLYCKLVEHYFFIVAEILLYHIQNYFRVERHLLKSSGNTTAIHFFRLHHISNRFPCGTLVEHFWKSLKFYDSLFLLNYWKWVRNKKGKITKSHLFVRYQLRYTPIPYYYYKGTNFIWKTRNNHLKKMEIHIHYKEQGQHLALLLWRRSCSLLPNFYTT